MTEGDRIPPTHLYKYKGPLRADASDSDHQREHLRRHREAIVDSRIYFAPPSKLNDPFDCEPCWINDATTTDIESYILRAAPRMSRSQSRAIGSDDRQRVRERTRDPEFFRDAWSKHNEEQGVCSLSEDVRQPLMWAHYGHSHTGYCLEFAFTDYMLESSTMVFVPLRVSYSSDRPVARTSLLLQAIGDRKMPEQFMRWLCQKDDGWAYEREWRLFSDGAPRSKPFPPRVLTTIVLGARCSEVDERTLRDWARQRPRPVVFRRAVPSPTNYSLSIEDAD